MDVQTLLDNIQELSDLELGVLICLIAQGHCLIATEDSLIDDLASELSLIVSERFGLSYCVLEQEDLNSVERFGEAILEEKGRQFSLEDDLQSGSLQSRLQHLEIRAAQKSKDDGGLDNRMIKNVVIAKGFNFAHEFVQVQAIEVINNRRMLSHTTVHIAPKTFLFLPIITASTKNVHLIPHLNDRILISHSHLPEHGFANLEELDHSGSSQSSSPHSSRRDSWKSQQRSRTISKEVIEKIRTMGDAADITPEVRRYLQDIVTFLRLERGVDGGLTPQATSQFVALAKYLAPLHGINFVTPSLVMLAARKVYPHRIMITNPGRERSMQYGSDLAAVVELLDGLTPQEVIEMVLRTVQCPI
ncbi:hypothetical protein H2198_001119 [Neophaeococcomyces mojaviensis]|uniref:Uncharacterized protein n=1 Tax=Neophaeococcomyces mojaviensis TaxID=3383035 RepID=A0ACC3AID2_9EURO|nr:hypothetical protein H2198_001119 [Knufia sp. JES_112]